jgi:4-amino-4-deoxy-L-arabinose transferase-like glycosyltransferase
MTRARWVWLSVWAATVGATLLARPAWPVDETRYLAVAWRMWTLDDLLVPRLGAEVYTDKPPLLFWLVHAGWALFGVSATSARLVPPLFALASLHLTARLARRLWPDEPAAGALAPLLLAGALLWSVCSTLLMFDTLLTCFTLLAMLALLAALDRGRGRDRDGDAAGGGGARAWLGLSLALGLGLLAKGPVLLLHVLPVALLAPAWGKGRRRAGWGAYYAGLAAALALGAGLALVWVVAATRGAEGLSGRAVVMEQSLKRVLASAAPPHVHFEAWWYYLALLPLALLPWTLWPRLWVAGARMLRAAPDTGVRLCVTWVGAALLLASAIPAKQAHYLLPLLPPLALLAARALGRVPPGPPVRDALLPALLTAGAGGLLLFAALAGLPGTPLAPGSVPAWPGALLLCAGGLLGLARAPDVTGSAARLTLASGLLLTVVIVGVTPALLPALDVRPAARLAAQWQAEGRPIASLDKYRGEYDFAGRLREPIRFLEPAEVPAWVDAHPDGVLLTTDERPGAGDPEPLATLNGGLVAWNVAGLPVRLRSRHLRRRRPPARPPGRSGRPAGCSAARRDRPARSAGRTGCARCRARC